MKLIYILFIFSVNAYADVIVVRSGEKNHVMQVDKDSSVAVPSGDLVVWDERVDGKLPSGLDPETIVVNKGAPREDADLKTAKAARDAARAAKEASDVQEKTDFAALKAKINSETATAAEIRKAFKFLLKKLGE